MIFAEVSFRARYGAPEVRSLSKFRVKRSSWDRYSISNVFCPPTVGHYSVGRGLLCRLVVPPILTCGVGLSFIFGNSSGAEFVCGNIIDGLSGSFSVFSRNIFGKSRKTSPSQKVASTFLGFSRKFRYKTAQGRATPPLELCHHSRAHRADRGRS